MSANHDHAARGKICFVSLNSVYLLYKTEQGNFMGGAELQQVLMGRELADRGAKVSFVTLLPEGAAVAAEQAIELLPTFLQSAGVPVVRFFYPRLLRICQALLKADADIFYVRGGNFILAPVVFLARLRKRKVVFCGAYDLDFAPDKIQMPSLKDKWLFFWGLKRVDAVIAQNGIQQTLAKQNFGLHARIVYNCYPISTESSSGQADALWVGNFRDTKNPEGYLELAEKIPDCHFHMIGGKPGQRDYERLRQAAQRIPNLTFLGFQPLEEVEKYFSKIRVFVNTSEFEGFPNTFLQAWSRGVPVVSFVDPDGLIARHRLGVVVNSPAEMAASVRKILQGELEFSSSDIQQYFSQNHSVEGVVDQYLDLFQSLLEHSGTPG